MACHTHFSNNNLQIIAVLHIITFYRFIYSRLCLYGKQEWQQSARLSAGWIGAFNKIGHASSTLDRAN